MKKWAIFVVMFLGFILPGIAGAASVLQELQADFDNHPALKAAGYKVKIREFSHGFLTLVEPIRPSMGGVRIDQALTFMESWSNLRYKAEALAKNYKEVKDVVWVAPTPEEIAKDKAEAEAEAARVAARAQAAKAQAMEKAKAEEAKSNAANKPVANKKPAGAPEGMVYVPMGCFIMVDINVNPPFAHEVCVSDFYMDKTEVTQDAYQKAIGSNPSSFKGCPNCPVEQVNWDEAKNYCARLGKRLPTEAEWEYAARSGGKKETYAGTSDDTQLGNYAWFSGNAGGKTHPVGEKQPNGLGLYDMSGNVWEWVADWYDGNYYQISRTNNPQGPASGQTRVLRGGSWGNAADNLRPAYRGNYFPGNRDYTFGFRCSQY